jgi:BirA family biotin operon repressor/biotin-[acetyl-CoA-carboxylase] ligase
VDARVSLALRRRRASSVPPEDLAADLGASTREILAAVERLGRRGYVIEAHPIQGLRLVSPPPALVAEEVACGLRVTRVGRRVRCVETAGSTNDVAWQAVEEGREVADGLAVFAEHQTAGRGRRGNRWLAPPHTSILCSVVLWMPNGPQQGGVLTRATAVAAAEAVEGASGLNVGIRWPNDLVVDDRKVAGILVEACPGSDGIGPVVIGIGINCGQQVEAFEPEIRPLAASLATLSREVDRTLLARDLLKAMDHAVAEMADHEGIRRLCRQAARRCQTVGRHVTLSDAEGVFSGEVVDLAADYELVLRLPGGGIRRFPAMTTHIVSCLSP